MEPLESYRPAEGGEEDADETEAPAEVEIAETPEQHREQAVREHQLLVDMRLRYQVPVREPLALISQISRSGGTLLSQLFDGHPQCHAHPDELMIGYPRRRHWPQLDLQDSPERWFEMLAEPTGSEK